MSSVTLVNLGRTGVRLPAVVLGTATFGLQCDEQSSASILARAAELGMTWLDTSTSYPLGSGADSVGVTESLLGRILGSRRDDYFIASKVYNRTGPLPWQLGLSRAHLVSAVEGSLHRLGADHLDLLQLHRWDEQTPIEETLAALDSLVQAGKVRYVGCCNFLAFQIARALTLSEWRGFPRLQSAQIRYNLLMRGAELETLRLCREEGVAALAFNVLGGGLLTGKYDRGTDPASTARFGTGEAGRRYTERYWNEETFQTIDELAVLAEAAEVPLAVLATGWVLRHPDVTAPIIGASRPEHLDVVAQAMEIATMDDVYADVDEITRQHRRLVPELEFESS